MSFWTNISSIPALNALRRVVGLRPQYHIWADASGSGYGGHLGPPHRPLAALRLSQKPITLPGETTPFAPKDHTNAHEALAIFVCPHRWAPRLIGADVLCHSDNASVCEALRVGRTNRPPKPNRPVTDDVLRAIRTVAGDHDITLRIKWVPRRDNHLADKLSRPRTAVSFFSHRVQSLIAPNAVTATDTTESSDPSASTVATTALLRGVGGIGLSVPPVITQT
jgi:hypothetical protein